jgi:hypothetical protein
VMPTTLCCCCCFFCGAAAGCARCIVGNVVDRRRHGAHVSAPNRVAPAPDPMAAPVQLPKM